MTKLPKRKLTVLKRDFVSLSLLTIFAEDVTRCLKIDSPQLMRRDFRTYKGHLQVKRKIGGRPMNMDKYKNAVLFFLEHVPDLGKVKLFKLLYFLDFDHFEKFGESVTGETYINRNLGPVPKQAEHLLEQMKAENLLDIRNEPIIDYVRIRLIPKVKHNPAVFKTTEIEMLCEVAEKWQHHTANEMVSATHGEAPWIATKLGEEIPYALAYYRGKFEEPDQDDIDTEVISSGSDSQGCSI